MESFAATTALRIGWRRLRYQTRCFTQGLCHLNLWVDDSVLHSFEACTETVDDGVAAFFLKATHVHAGDVDFCSKQDLELSLVTLVTRGSPKVNVVITPRGPRTLSTQRPH